ncbi:MAG: hypothetical protein KAV87_57620 [Desulfobacteraceae bacterium]|nr:hypothetical protein [Desulfobacteraceae bacterium]
MRETFNKEGEPIVLRLRDFESRSISEYASWLEMHLGLKQVNVNKIWSVRISKSINKLEIDKRKLLEEIDGNLEILREYINGEEIKDKEVIVALSISNQWAFWRELVSDQVDRLSSARRLTQMKFELEYSEEENDIPPF